MYIHHVKSNHFRFSVSFSSSFSFSFSFSFFVVGASGHNKMRFNSELSTKTFPTYLKQ